MDEQEKCNRGRPKGKVKEPSAFEVNALAYVLAGAPAHAAAAAALTEAQADPAIIAAVETALTLVEGGGVVTINESGEFEIGQAQRYVPPTAEDVENARRMLELDRISEPVAMHPDDPAADMDDGGQNYLWMPSAFREHGKPKLLEVRVKLTGYKGGERSEADTLAQYVRRRTRAKEEASLRAAEAYCKAIEEYAERYDFQRVPDDWGGWRFDAPQDQLDAMYDYARAEGEKLNK